MSDSSIAAFAAASALASTSSGTFGEGGGAF
jgi:hypothetical protein